MKALQFLFNAYRTWDATGGRRLGAALAYYAIFSAAPLFVITISITEIVLDPQLVRHEVHHFLKTTLGVDGGRVVEALLRSRGGLTGNWLAIVGSVGLMMLTASRVFVELQDGMNILLGIEKERARITDRVKARIGAVLIVFGGSILLFLSILANVTLNIINALFSSAIPFGKGFWSAIHLGADYLLISAILYFLYKNVPSKRMTWRVAGKASLFAGLLFVAGKIITGEYLLHIGNQSPTGAAGALVVVLAWTYFSAQMLYFGVAVANQFALEEEALPAPLQEADKPAYM